MSSLVVVDAGGTNTNIGLMVYRQDQWILQERWRVPTHTITDITAVLAPLLQLIAQRYNMVITHMVMGVAGRVHACHEDAPCDTDSCVAATNSALAIDCDMVKDTLSLEKLWLVNDFVLVAYGIDHMSPEQYQVLPQRYAQDARQQRACIGAGTGLGTVYITGRKDLQQPLVVLSSEGGHGAAPVPESDEEQALYAHMQAYLGVARLSYEDLVASRGLQAVCASKLTMERALYWYTVWYARYAQSVALHGLAAGGIYIAGGIIAHNPTIVQSDIFTRTLSAHERYHDFLQHIPLISIIDYDISLYGAAWYYTAQLHQ